MPAYSRSAAAPALVFDQSPETEVAEAPRPQVQPRTVQYQRPLFPHRDLPQVIQLLEKPSPQKTAAPARSPRQPRRAAPIPGQQRLDFPAIAPTPRPAPPAITSLIDCNALTAPLTQRITAFACDATIVVSAFAIFLGVGVFAMKTFPTDRMSLCIFGFAFLTILALYKTMWCLGNGHSPGLRWAQLRLVTFHGHRPSRKQLFQRAFAGILSFAAMSLGLLWALVDEEALTWHDHISKCFPTSDPVD
jgi:uncharacterized RDD family membrane protein YckC